MWYQYTNSFGTSKNIARSPQKSVAVGYLTFITDLISAAIYSFWILFSKYNVTWLVPELSGNDLEITKGSSNISYGF